MVCVCVCVCVCAGTRDSTGFFTHLTDVPKEGLGRYFSGRPDLNVIAEPGVSRGLKYCGMV